MKIIRSPDGSERNLVNDEAGYPGWFVEAEGVTLPPPDNVWDAVALNWVYSPELAAWNAAMREARSPVALVDHLTAIDEAVAGLGAPAWNDIADKPTAFPPSAHTHSGADVTGLSDALNGKANVGHTHSPADIIGLPSGSDPWTYIKLASDFPTTSATAVIIPGLAFTPLLSQQYEFEATLLLRTATATVGPRPGLAWPTGGVDGVARIDTTSSATAALITNGNISAPMLAAVGGLPNTTASWPSYIVGTFRAGLTPLGNVQLRIASETAGATVTVKAGSFLKYRTI